MLELLHRDERLVAVAKPSGLVVHRSALARDRHTCLSVLREQLGRRVWPAHRLDRGTSGVLLFALDAACARELMAAFARRQARKAYLALVRGWADDAREIDHPLGGAAALTRVRCLARVELPCPVGRYASARYSLVEAEPLTGREHQVRRHLRHVDHPVVGDVTWGDGRHNRFVRERFGLRRLLLHALRLELPHPFEPRLLRLRAPLPDELRRLLAELGLAEAGARAEADAA